MRMLSVALILAVRLGAAMKPVGESDRLARLESACEMDPTLTRMARSFMYGFLTDTGIQGEVYAGTRAEIGVTGVRYAQVVIVQDTVKCRAALTSWKRLWATFGEEFESKSAPIDNGMLFQLTPNRFILATPYYNPYTGNSYLALDSNWVVIRKNL